jgi:hypothetical protein
MGTGVLLQLESHGEAHYRAHTEPHDLQALRSAECHSDFAALGAAELIAKPSANEPTDEATIGAASFAANRAANFPAYLAAEPAAVVSSIDAALP